MRTKSFWEALFSLLYTLHLNDKPWWLSCRIEFEVPFEVVAALNILNTPADSKLESLVRSKATTGLTRRISNIFCSLSFYIIFCIISYHSPAKPHLHNNLLTYVFTLPQNAFRDWTYDENATQRERMVMGDKGKSEIPPSGGGGGETRHKGKVAGSIWSPGFALAIFFVRDDSRFCLSHNSPHAHTHASSAPFGALA